MRLLAAVMACLAVLAVCGCGGGSGSSAVSSTTAKQSAALEKLLRQAEAVTGETGAAGVGAGGKILTPQEAKKVFREVRERAQEGGSGERAVGPIEEMLKRLRSSH